MERQASIVGPQQVYIGRLMRIEAWGLAQIRAAFCMQLHDHDRGVTRWDIKVTAKEVISKAKAGSEERKMTQESSLTTDFRDNIIWTGLSE